MIGERNIVSAGARATGIAVMGSEVIALVYELRWMVALSLCLIFADFWLGLSESRMTGREIRKSKAFRRTANKVVDYICYIMVAGLLGRAIGEPMGFETIKVAAVVMMLACAWELDSIYGHICVLNGAEPDFSIHKWVVDWLKAKGRKITGNKKDYETDKEGQ